MTSQKCVLEPFEFQQVGGRCKLVLEDDFASCAYCEESRRATRDRDLRAEWLKHQEALRLQRLQDQVTRWLKEHNFQGVNEPKVSRCGLRRTFPLLEAARTQQAMVPLLVRCGANPMQKDLLGYTVLDRLQCQGLRARVRKLWRNWQAAQF
ncbi:unnamed protein product [Effrenium voratum]|uniref:Uncharacterized protein n=1 Tax=Effrenium voratum TaxID=2562239 RepID=A0AA36IWU1_9DINO|nr:unnamed protein product [Effrenium voratum]